MGTKTLERKDASLAEKALAAHRATIYLTTSMLMPVSPLGSLSYRDLPRPRPAREFKQEKNRYPEALDTPRRLLHCLFVAPSPGGTVV